MIVSLFILDNDTSTGAYPFHSWAHMHWRHLLLCEAPIFKVVVKDRSTNNEIFDSTKLNPEKQVAIRDQLIKLNQRPPSYTHLKAILGEYSDRIQSGDRLFIYTKKLNKAKASQIKELDFKNATPVEIPYED